MNNNFGKIFSIGLAALLLAPVMAQAQSKIKAGKGIANALKGQSNKLSETIDALSKNAQTPAAQYIRETYRVEVPTEHFVNAPPVIPAPASAQATALGPGKDDTFIPAETASFTSLLPMPGKVWGSSCAVWIPNKKKTSIRLRLP